MARQTLTKTQAPGSYPSAGVTLTFTAADATNKEQAVFTADELLICRNTGAGAHTVTINSSANANGRTGDIAAESLAAGAYKVFGPFTSKDGWVQSGGYLFMEAADAEVEWAVVKLTQ